MQFSKHIQQINDDLLRFSETHFDVLRPSGSRLAGVTLTGNHRIEVSATIYPGRGQEPCYGEATTFRKDGENLTIEQVASAFGSAYVRATDPRYNTPGLSPLPTGPIEVGDFVEVEGKGRGIVLDILQSVRHGHTVSLVVRLTSGDTETAVLRSQAKLIAKGR